MPQRIQKEILIEKLLAKITKNSPIDFMLYLGNDSSDEPVYEILKSTRI
jgi:trehalose-6-phosphatase